MANIIERDIVLQGRDDNGNPTIDLPITRLGNIEDTADVKAALAATDYLPLIDMADNGQMKKILASVLLAALTQNITLEKLGAAAAKHGHAAEDITSGTLADERIPNLSADKITSGTMAAARLPTTAVNKGGTGKTSWTANRLIYPSAATTLAQLAFPSVAGSVLRQGTSGAPYWTSLTDLAAELGISGAAKIATGSYTGTGTYGSSNPCSLTFDFVPRLLVIISSYLDGFYYSHGFLIFVNPAPVGFGILAGVNGIGSSCITGGRVDTINSQKHGITAPKVTWGNTKVSWNSDSSVPGQFNVSSCSYGYCAIG